MLKKVSARSRPFHRDPSLDSGLRILDLYSFPSGHCMTAAAVGLPYGLTFRYAFVPFLIGWLLIAWSRLASGHHYPSDILFGSLIGGAISLGVLVFIT
jgi:undecaprenyl-diphosphatase